MKGIRVLTGLLAYLMICCTGCSKEGPLNVVIDQSQSKSAEIYQKNKITNFYVANNRYYDHTHEKAQGSITWLNRSVIIQGQVCPYWYNAKIVFNFYQGSKFLTSQSRTVSNGGCLPFHFTQEGPRGGITSIRIYLYGQDGSCTPSLDNPFQRP